MGCLLLVLAAGRFERAVFRRSVSDKRGEFHLAADRVWRFELSLKHQCSRVAAHVPERKFHRAGKRHRVLVAWRPLRFRRFRRPPPAQHWIQQQKSAFPVGLSVEAQRTLVPVREIDLDVPSAGHGWRLGLSEGGGEACLDDDHQNDRTRCSHIFPCSPELTTNEH